MSQRLGRLEIDRLADEHRATHMRHDKAQPPAHLIIDQAVTLMAEDAEQRGSSVICRARPLQIHEPCGRTHSL